MKKIKVYSLGIAGMVAMGSYLSAGPPVADPAQKLYDSKCSSCHGKDGKGKPAMAKIFKAEPAALDLIDEATLAKKDEDILKIIAEGKNKMPGYGKQLKAEEQKSVLQYIRGLAPKKEETK